MGRVAARIGGPYYTVDHSQSQPKTANHSRGKPSLMLAWRGTAILKARAESSVG